YKAPEHWPIHPKEDTWTVKPSPGSHAIEDSLPLLLVVRDILDLADTAREAKMIINQGEILVDGTVRKDYKFPVGFMDVIQIPKTGKTYRVLPDDKGRLVLHPISEENQNFKLCRIQNKTTIRGGKQQLNLHDGRNCLVEGEYRAGDVVVLQVPKQEVTQHLKLENGALGFITGGKHIGELGTIKEINITKSSMPNTILMETGDGKSFQTLQDYVFVLGKDQAMITLPGGK
ncbi:MAG TPA: 30S ribosomal protein S4e, partial [Methanobacteriaceae archaeon]|nr:30S ribosomal protein S4e [Methanobacteriaceae archaeon]